MNKTQLSNIKKAFAAYKSSTEEIEKEQQQLLSECQELERNQDIIEAKHTIKSLLGK